MFDTQTLDAAFESIKTTCFFFVGRGRGREGTDYLICEAYFSRICFFCGLLNLYDPC